MNCSVILNIYLTLIGFASGHSEVFISNVFNLLGESIKLPTQILSKGLESLQDPVTRKLCKLTTPELITYYGYNVEEHTVTTDDGYILTIFRCNSRTVSPNGRVVILQHGLVISSDEFVENIPSQAPAYILADVGYDVWITNNRGNIYSRKHITKNPDLGKLGNFWEFSWDDIAFYDYPAVWKYVRANTNTTKLYIVGFSQGCTATLALLSEYPEYNGYVHAVACLSPVSYLQYAGTPQQILAALLPVLKTLENSELFSRSINSEVIGTYCASGGLTICNLAIDFINGPSDNQRNASMFPTFLCHLPSGSSMNQLVHYEEQVKYGYFGRKKKGAEIPPDFPLHQITAPTILFYSPVDTFTNAKDMDRLISKLNGTQDLNINVIDEFNFGHADFILTMNSYELLYSKVLKFFDKHQ